MKVIGKILLSIVLCLALIQPGCLAVAAVAVGAVIGGAINNSERDRLENERILREQKEERRRLEWERRYGR